MRRTLSLLLAMLTLCSAALPFPLFSNAQIESAAQECDTVVVSSGKPAVFGPERIDAAKLTDGDTLTSSGHYVDSGAYGAYVQPRQNAQESSCYAQIDLQGEYPLESVSVVCYYKDARVYHWDAYAGSDPDAPIGQWTLLGGKTTDEPSSQEGYTVNVSGVNARYLRIYGTYNSKNDLFHPVEVTVRAALKPLPVSSLVTGSASSSGALLTDGRTDTGYVEMRWGASREASSAYGLAGDCFVTLDLGQAYLVSFLNLVTYFKDARFYRWAVYGSCDAALPAAQWTFLGEKSGDERSYENGYTIALERTPVRYLRVYGTYNSANVSFHFIEISAFAASEKSELSIHAPATLSSGERSDLLTDGRTDVPVLLGEREEFGENGGCFARIDLGWQANVYSVRVSAPEGSRFSLYGAPSPETAAEDRIFLARGDGEETVFEETALRCLWLYALDAPSDDFLLSEIRICGDLPQSSRGNLLSIPEEGSAFCRIDDEAYLVLAGVAPEYLLSGAYSFRFVCDNVEYAGFAIDHFERTAFDACTVYAKLETMGFFPGARMAHDGELFVYSGEELEKTYFLPPSSAPQAVTDLLGRSLEVFASLGSVVLYVRDGEAVLTANSAQGSDFDGWYENGESFSRELSISVPLPAGSDRTITGIFSKGKDSSPSGRRYGSTVTTGAQAPSLRYEFYNDLSGSASGILTFLPAVTGDYAFFWLGREGEKLSCTVNDATLSYSALESFRAQAGQAHAFSPQPYTAIPQGAAAIGVFKADALVCALTIPEEKRFDGEMRYAYGVLSDLHYNSFFSDGVDAAPQAVNDAYAFYRSAGVVAVFETGDLSAAGEESAYQKHRAAEDASGLLVLACGGNHEAWYANGIDYMYGENGIWKKYMNHGVYDGSLPGVEEIAPNGFDFVYTPPGGDVFVFVSQILWDNKEADQPYLVPMETMRWLESVLETHKDDVVHLFLHTYLPDDDDENVDGEGDLSNLAGYGYHYHYNVQIEDGKLLRELMDRYENVIWYNGHSHWIYAMQKYNENLNIYDNGKTTATMLHVPSVSGPRTVSDYQVGYTTNAGTMSEGALTFVYDGNEVMNGVDFKTGEILSYACYRIYTDKEGVVFEEEIAQGLSSVFDRQTGRLTLCGSGALPGAEISPLAAYASQARSLYVARGVVSLGENAFAGFENLQKAEIKEGAEALGANAFANCRSLSELFLPRSLTALGQNAFAGTPEDITLHFAGTQRAFTALQADRLAALPETAQVDFAECIISFSFGDVLVEKVYRKGEIPSYDGEVFNATGDPDTAYRFIGWTDGPYTYADALPAVSTDGIYYARFSESPGGVLVGRDRGVNYTVDLSRGRLTLSGMGLMPDYDEVAPVWSAYAEQIEEIRVEEGVFSIGKNAFAGLSGVRNLILPERLTKIGEEAFAGMTALARLSLPSTFRYAAANAPAGCSSLTSVTYPGTMEDYAGADALSASFAGTAPFTYAGGVLVFSATNAVPDACTVRFFSQDGTLLSESTVAYGADAAPPEVPAVAGKYFLGWSGSYRNVQEDLTLRAVYSDTPYPDLDAPVQTKTLNVYPMYGKIENYGGTAFIVGIESDDNEALFANFRSGALQLRFTVTHEASGRQYRVGRYFFENPGSEFYGSSFLRLYVCKYGVVPEPGETYTLALEVYSYRNLFYTGVSAKGAFTSSAQAQVPAVVSHDCEVICVVHEALAGAVSDCTEGFTCRYCHTVVAGGEHTPVIDPMIPPGDGIDGRTQGCHCGVCGKVLAPQQTIPYVWGDVTGNGYVTIADVTAELNLLSGQAGILPEYKYDVNLDGVYSIEDVTSLLNLLSGVDP